MTTKNRWHMFADRYPWPERDTPEWLQTQQTLTAVNYRGTTSHDTEDQARDAANAILNKLQDHSPNTHWTATIYCPYTNPGTRIPREGVCYMVHRNPATPST